MKNTIVEALRRLTEDQNDKEIATEEDWDNCLEELPNEFEYEDLGLEIFVEEDEAPVGWDSYTDSIVYQNYPAKQGTLNKYIFYCDPDYELVLKYLGKKDKNEVTKEDLISVVNDENIYSSYSTFVLENCRDKALEEAEEEWKEGSISPYDVDWFDEDAYYADLAYDAYKDSGNE